jgi:hypothetical protein
MMNQKCNKDIGEELGIRDINTTIYIYKSETGWLALYLSAFVCVLLGDGSGVVFFLVSSRPISYWQRGRFLFGQF